MAINLGSVQLQIMRVLWSEGEASARRITEVLSESKEIAHSTVQTLLRQLEAKKAVAHEQRDRTFVFRALVKESEVSRTAAQDLLTRVFQGSISGLVSHLLDSEDISESEMNRLRKLVREKTQEVKK
jgi:BlaI family transcriptional regulator, penicillinase repressor